MDSPIVGKNCLRVGVTSLSTATHTAPPSVPSVKVIAGSTSRDSLLEEYLELTIPTGMNREVQCDTTHYIRTTLGPPVAYRPLRLTPDHLAVVRPEFDSMLRESTARRAEGP